MRAFFFRQVEGASDVTKTNEQTVWWTQGHQKIQRVKNLIIICSVFLLIITD